jgi:hypothetical protein
VAIIFLIGEKIKIRLTKKATKIVYTPTNVSILEMEILWVLVDNDGLSEVTKTEKDFRFLSVLRSKTLPGYLTF